MTTLSRTRTLALAGLVAPVWFTAMVVIQGELHPRYSHVTMPISALAAWPMGWMQNLTFYVAGVLVIAFVVALHRSVRQAHRGRAGHVLLLIGGAALAMMRYFRGKSSTAFLRSQQLTLPARLRHSWPLPSA